jgi:hypothetical protein
MHDFAIESRNFHDIYCIMKYHEITIRYHEISPLDISLNHWWDDATPNAQTVASGASQALEHA